jgi:hypothetical protein
MTYYRIESEFGEVALELSEWGEGGRRVRLHCTERYGQELHRYLSLFALAKKDFPELTERDVTPIIMGGDHHKEMVGIEFNPGEAVVPAKYFRVGEKFRDPKQ